MNNLQQFGEKIKEVRRLRGETAQEVSDRLGRDRSYLSNIEAGREKPSLSYFKSLISHYSISEKLTLELASLIGYEVDLKWIVKKELTTKEVSSEMDQKVQADTPKGLNLNISPDKVQVLYTDSVFISSDEFGVVFNVSQKIGDNNFQVVSRFGMSKDHAKKFAEVLARHLALTITGPKNQEEKTN